MKLRHPTLEKIARALEFANVDSVGEMEALLDRHAEALENAPAAKDQSRPALVRPAVSARIFKLSGSHC